METICRSDKTRLSSNRKDLHPKVKISVIVVIDVEANNALHFSPFLSRQIVPITSIHTGFILSSWIEFDVRLSLIGSKEMIRILSFVPEEKVSLNRHDWGHKSYFHHLRQSWQRGSILMVSELTFTFWRITKNSVSTTSTPTTTLWK